MEQLHLVVKLVRREMCISAVFSAMEVKACEA